MRSRAILVIIAIAAASLMVGGWGAASAQPTTTCTWGGTPAEPTGKVYYTGQGITKTQSTEPLPFEAKVIGLRGVVRAVGDNAVGLVPALLYDKSGNLVGSENPQVLTSGTEQQNLGFTSCNSPEGFKDGNFSSVIELFG